MAVGLDNVEFKTAAERVKTLATKPDNSTLLKVRAEELGLAAVPHY